MAYYIGIDIGGTEIKYGVFSKALKKQVVVKTNTIRDNKAAFLAEISQVTIQFQKEYSIAGIGVSMPGFIDPEIGIAEESGAIISMRGSNIIYWLEQATGLPVEVENDANAALLGEYQCGAGRGYENLALITLGTGIGGAILYNGDIFHGKAFRAGELGMMIAERQGKKTRNLHSAASARGLIEAYQQAWHLDKPLNGREIFAGDVSDKTTHTVLENWADHVATCVFILMTTVDPEAILIGGGISKQPIVIEHIRSAVLRIPGHEMFTSQINACELGNEAGMIGAVYHYLRRNGEFPE